MKVPANSLPIEDTGHRQFIACVLLIDIFLLCFCIVAGARELSGIFLLLNKGTNFIHESSTLMSESLPRGTTFKYHHIGGIGLNVYLAGTKTLNL